MMQKLTAATLIAELQAHANPANVAGMARYGIATEHTLGVPIPILRALAKRAGKDHRLAGELWASGIHEARILATMVEIRRASHQPGWTVGRTISIPGTCAIRPARTCFARRRTPAIRPSNGLAPAPSSCAAPPFR